MALHRTCKRNTVERKGCIITQAFQKNIDTLDEKFSPKMGANHLTIFFLMPLADLREVRKLFSCKP